MTRRKLLYVFVVSLIMLMGVIYFVFLMPREHVYSGTLASNTTTIYQTLHV